MTRDAPQGGVATLTAGRRGQPGTMRLRLARLRVIEGADAGVEVELSADPVTIGSHRSCALVLADPTVSARHAETALRPAGYIVRDLGSKNGVFVNDVRVDQAYLSPGACITLGSTRIEVEDPGKVVTYELSGARRFGALVGASVAMRRLFAALERAAPTDLTILLAGETGTGKTLVAREIHNHGPCPRGPFETFDCGSVQPNLVESELFGHERGAFTGAVSSHVGAIERADGGTLFLDEIGELPLGLQPKLLRTLESRQFMRVGGTRPRKARVRFIAASNRRLDRDVRDGRFRQDLYYRIAVVHIEVPALRDRIEDLPLLVDHFATSLGIAVESPSDRVRGLVPLLANHGWPGNVRELRNVVERLSVLSPEQALPTALRPDAAAEDLLAYEEARQRALDHFERLYVRDLLRHTRGNVSQAAELSGVSRRYLCRLMARHEIDRREAARSGPR